MTYRYELVNDSATQVPIVNVVVSDDRCAPLIRTSGDVTNPGVLDVSETWTYGCATQYKAAGAYVNTAVATGQARPTTSPSRPDR